MSLNRWPVHPRPGSGECLSSWLRRLGMTYGIKLRALVHLDLGFPEVEISKLDLNPPPKLLDTLAARTGTSVEAIQKMTLAGILPHILSRSAEECSFLFSLWDRSFLPEEFPLNWEQWIRLFRKRPLNGCRICLRNYPHAAVPLAWRLPIMLCCPKHGLMLEPVRYYPDFVKWHNSTWETAPESLKLIDGKSWFALSNGYVILPTDNISAFSWFQGLRTILEVLDSRSGSTESLPKPPWKEMVLNATYDLLTDLPWETKRARLDALFLASAISLMEAGAIDPLGLHAS